MIIYNTYQEELVKNNIINENIIEHWVIGNDFSTTNKTSIGDQISQSQSNTNQTNTTQTNQTNYTDNSVESHNTVQSSTSINASQQIQTTNEIDQSSEMSISSSADTFNYDMSQSTNQTTSNIENKMIQSCGATIEEAQAAVNITTDESINTNINNGNVFINTGDNVTISDVRLESELTFLGPSVDRSCMLDAMSELNNEMSAENDNTKSFAGGSGGDIGALSGGNVSSADSEAEKSDNVSASMSSSNSLTQENQTSNTNETETITTSEATTEISTEISSETSVADGSGGGIINIMLIYIILFYNLRFKFKR